ncbi:hypothetical protein BDW59DRAFT_149172 [Aspergillus cavernicola]|uniref:Uncharacterized protein n=1 Tax=Aspergillus cavernicola TaxID=176166 RepID=A0ABR4I4W8_9EURO
MKSFISTAVFTLLAASSATAVSLPRTTVRTVVFTNEMTGHGEAADIPTTGLDVSVKDTYPALFDPVYRIDSVLISAGLLAGAKCNVHASSADGVDVALAEVNNERNYAKIPTDTPFVPETLQVQCV